MNKVWLLIFCLLLAGCSNTVSDTITSYQDAVNTAKAKNKDMLLIFSASWCPPCQRMKKTTLKNDRVKSAMSNYVVYKIDVDIEDVLSDRYKVRSIPRYLIVNPDEKVIKNAGGYKSPDDFIRWLK